VVVALAMATARSMSTGRSRQVDRHQGRGWAGVIDRLKFASQIEQIEPLPRRVDKDRRGAPTELIALGGGEKLNETGDHPIAPADATTRGQDEGSQFSAVGMAEWRGDKPIVAAQCLLELGNPWPLPMYCPLAKQPSITASFDGLHTEFDEAAR